ncbi:MAG: ABC transporter ATP-binding protein [Wolinella sp.]
MIVFKSVSKIFRDKSGERGVFDISFEIPLGESCLLKGASGSGKSTILSLISALTRPSSGELSVCGKHLSLMPDYATTRFRLENIGFIFQRFHLVPDMSVMENVALAMIPFNVGFLEIEERVRGVLARFGMQNKEKSLARDLSGGEQQRVVIARALVNSPTILLADEPTASLDPVLKRDFLMLLEELKSEGRTLIVSSHDSELLDGGFFSRHIELKDGCLV